MRILLTGRNGQVGWELERTLSPLGQVFAFDRASLDLGDPAALAARVRETQPQVIVNAAAYTAVDRAESEPDLAHRINGVAPGILAQEARRIGALLVHYSTDYVFDGERAGAYAETDTANPVNAYGASKLAGERAVEQAAGDYLILRTSWVYGARGRNFLRTIVRLASTQDRLRVIDDQIGAPTWCRLIAEATSQILAQRISRAGVRAGDESGTFHIACAGKASWHGFAQAIFDELAGDLGRCPPLEPIGTQDYPLPARRPANSLLDCGKLERAFGLALPDWRRALALCARDGQTPLRQAAGG